MNKQKLLTSIKRDIEFTSGNYAQMYNRLKLNDSISKFLITYYSTVSIIYALFPLFVEDKIVYLTGLDFLMMSLSVVVLIASLLISFAQYGERSKQVMTGLDRLKRLKKELLQYSDDNFTKELYKKFIDEYHGIVDSIELRSDLDYFRTCKELNSRGKYTESWQQISCLNKLIMYMVPIFKFLFFFALFLFPIIVLFIIF